MVSLQTTRLRARFDRRCKQRQRTEVVTQLIQQESTWKYRSLGDHPGRAVKQTRRSSEKNVFLLSTADATGKQDMKTSQ